MKMRFLTKFSQKVHTEYNKRGKKIRESVEFFGHFSRIPRYLEKREFPCKNGHKNESLCLSS